MDGGNNGAGSEGKTEEEKIDLMKPSENEKNIIANIGSKIKQTFWSYYKDHKTDMIEEQSFNGSYFKDEHGFDSSGSSEEDGDNG